MHRKTEAKLGQKPRLEVHELLLLSSPPPHPSLPPLLFPLKPLV